VAAGGGQDARDADRGACEIVGPFDRRGDEDGRRRRLRESGGDAVQLVIDYVKQETLEPVKGLGRFLLMGVAGSLALCVGVVLLLVGLLRLLQTETGAFHGNLSWLPYLIVTVVAVALAGLCGWRIVKGPATRRRPGAQGEGT
jgi:hypothetical protein